MPIQNRVLPTGDIVVHPARGLFMGNRGVLHDDHRTLRPARWKHRNWVCCVLSFKGRKRQLMTPGRYTELFFLDEAVALAAGHRPCGECRRADYAAYRDAWARATGTTPTPKEMDAILHAARAERGGRRLKTWDSEAGSLPPGTFISGDGGPVLMRADHALPFAPDGYGAPRPRPAGRVTVLTPAPSVAVLSAGFTPRLHPSAETSRNS
jgi:hypothetical protein